MDVELLAISLAVSSAIPAVWSFLRELRARLGPKTAKVSLQGPDISVEFDSSPETARKLETQVLGLARDQKIEQRITKVQPVEPEDPADGSRTAHE